MTSNEQESADLSLEQVENHVWGDAPGDATRFMATVHWLRRKLIKHLTAADLRMLIAQRVGLAVLVPRVLPHLERDPYLEADYYPGDLRHQLGDLRHQQVTQLTARAETAEHNDQQAAEKLQHWHHELADALAEPGEHNQQLTTRIEQLLAAGSDSAWTRDGLGS